MAVGRISGPLLKDNLLRDGVNLAFETDLLYLDVVNGRVGINTKTPAYDLDVSGTARTTNLEVSTTANIADFTLTNSTISSSQGTISFVPSGINPVVYQAKILVDSNLRISTNTIETTVTNSDLNINTTGSGEVVINNNVTVNGDLHATGNITADGDIQIGDANTDSVEFKADIASNIIPDVTNTYDLGSDPTYEYTPGVYGKEWANTYAHNLYSTNITSDTISVNGIDLTLAQGNIYYVSSSGSDSNSGTRPNDPFLTIKHALSVATTGETVYVYSGTYVEAFPLTIPQGVTIKGAGIRAVRVRPTVSTRFNDGFILNGDTTVEDLSITDYFSGGNYFTVTAASAGSTTVNVGTAPFAHTYSTGGSIIIGGATYSISGATYTHTTGVLVLSHTTGTATPGDRVFISNLTFTCNGGNRIFPDNGYGFRFATDLNVINRSPYIRNCTGITRGTPTVLSINSIKTQNNASIARIKDIIDELVVNTTITVSSGNIETQVKDLTNPSNGTVGTALQVLIDNVLYVINNGPSVSALPTIVPNGSLTTTASKLNAAALITSNYAFLKAEMVAYVATTYAGFWSSNSQVKAERDLGIILDALVYDITHDGNERSIAAGIGYWQNSSTDPYGYDSADAGKGAYIDGAYALPTSKEASMLFHSVTFITPNVDTITTTNGARIEWLNSFTYFANRGIYAFSSNDGFAGQGLTRLRIDDKVGTWAVGNTLTYYDTDGTTVLASGVINSINGNYVNLTGKCIGFETITDRVGKTVYAQGNAKLSTAQKKFGTASLALDGTGDYANIPSQPDFNLGQGNRPTKTITVTGDAAISATQSKFGGKSIAFDGTGDKITVTSSADFAFGTGNFTAEAWVYRNTATGSHCIFDFRSASASNNGILLFTNNNIQYYVGGSTRINVTTSGTAGAWNHVALVRNSGTTNIYLNGTSVGSYVDGQSYAASTVTIGGYYNNTAYFNGYIDEARVSNTARYTGTFTPSATAFVHDQNSLLLIHGDTSISDDAGDQTAGVFALETFVYPLTAGGYRTIFDMRTTNTDTAIFVGLLPTNEVYVYINGSIVIQSPSALSFNTWTHIALTKQNQSLRLFINGVQAGSTYTDTTNYPQRPLIIGATFDALSGFVGYIDEVRLSKGVSRYITTFTPPTSALTGDLSTVLLLHFDGPNNATAFLDDGITYQDLKTDALGTATLINFADYSDFGAEIRSIGSANIYGNYGTYGDGDGVIAYLISQNYAYVGSGKKATNDPNDRIAANEVTELNRAHIYYTSVDNEGNFSVGDSFYVNQKTGEVLFNAESLSVTSTQGVVFTDGVDTTTILPGEVDTGNIKIYNNNIDSVLGPINIVPYDGILNLGSDTNITGNLDVTGNVTIGGNITIGDQNTDSINFVAAISSNLIPATTATYNLGQLSPVELRWNNLYLNRIEIDGLVIDNNEIATTANNDNLVLTANGTGVVYVPTSDVQVNQNVTVGQDLTVTTGLTDLQDVNITGTLTQVGDFTQTGNFNTTGNLTVTGDITGTGNLTLPEVTIIGSTISGTSTNTDLILQANGLGEIHIVSTDVTVDQNLTVGGTLDVTGDSTFGNITVNGTITHTGDYNQTGNFVTTGTIDAGSVTSSGTLTMPGITISGNTIESTTTDTDLTITANGTGVVSIPINDVDINQNLTVSGTLDVTGLTTLGEVQITGNVTQTGDINQTGDFTTSGDLTVTGNTTLSGGITIPNITISGSSIATNTDNLDLVLSAAGTGKVIIQDLGINGTVITGEAPGNITITPQGTAGVVINSTLSMVIPVGTTLERPAGANGMIRYNTSLTRYEGYANGVWLALAGIESSDGLTRITPELTPGAGDNVIRFYANNTLVATIDSTKLYAIAAQTDDLDISNNTISAITTDTDINITTSGTGGVVVGDLKFRNSEIANTVSGGITEFTEVGTGYVKIAGTYGTVLPSGNTSTRPLGINSEVGMTRYNTELQYVEVWNGTAWQNVAAQSGGINFVDATSTSIVNAIVFG